MIANILGINKINHNCGKHYVTVGTVHSFADLGDAMKQIILSAILSVALLTGCATQPTKQNSAELLTPAEAPVEQQKIEEQEPEKGFGYYATVVVGTVLYTGVVILNEIVAHNH